MGHSRDTASMPGGTATKVDPAGRSPHVSVFRSFANSFWQCLWQCAQLNTNKPSSFFSSVDCVSFACKHRVEPHHSQVPACRSMGRRQCLQDRVHNSFSAAATSATQLESGHACVASGGLFHSLTRVHHLAPATSIHRKRQGTPSPRGLA